ncbi:sensor histidine kinase [Pseudomonas laurylsulfatiphila]|uniref:sensor histidine kinase n=1 Tax=Pseudomonas laurylsulfatiphila TaxID=2011015 RepID=UPI0021606BA7|nr:ATP-binding protein [Pseudomonas laurylsulfatiphila]UVM02519.1 histidine kinase [Pseudomonas laurylsulfatiphila]
MAKNAKAESENQTFTAQQAEAQDEPAPVGDVSRNGLLRTWIRGRARKLSHSTQFVIAAAVILGLTMFFVGNLVSVRIESAAVHSAAEAGAQYMDTFLEPFVQELSQDNTLSAASIQSLDRLTESRSLKQHIVSIKIWRADGTVVYSTNRDITNVQFPLDEITEALKGKVVTDLQDLTQDENAFERTLNVPLYEIYAPLRDSRSGKIIAVGEFYEKADSLRREINRVREEVWGVVGAATLAMLTLLFFIVRRGDKIIQQQQVALHLRLIEQTRLHISNAELQHKMATATQEFSRVNELTLRRIGADLHDGPAQLLTLILIRLDDVAENCTAVDQESLETIRAAATDALREVRDLSRGLALPEINDVSLVEELQLVAQRHEQRTGTKVTLTLGQLPKAAPLPLKLCLYRFVQEALNNAYRHANGEGQVILAKYIDGVLNISVRDSGPGMAADAMQLEKSGRTRLGLAGLRYRVESLGGLFSIDSCDAGTSVNAQFKL